MYYCLRRYAVCWSSGMNSFCWTSKDIYGHLRTSTDISGHPSRRSQNTQTDWIQVMAQLLNYLLTARGKRLGSPSSLCSQCSLLHQLILWKINQVAHPCLYYLSLAVQDSLASEGVVAERGEAQRPISKFNIFCRVASLQPRVYQLQSNYRPVQRRSSLRTSFQVHSTPQILPNTTIFFQVVHFSR